MTRHEGFHECWSRFAKDLDARQLPVEFSSPVAQTQALVQIGGELAYLNDLLGRILANLEKQ